MQRFLTLLMLLIFCQAFGQVEKDSLAVKPEYIDISIITSLCIDIPDWKDRKECSKQEILEKIRKELNYDIVERLPDQKYHIKYIFLFDQNGYLIKKNAQINNDILQTEFQRVINELELDFNLQDQNGNLTSGRFIFPVTFIIESGQ